MTSKVPYQFGEAFMLMWYVCKECGHRERLWNSRNGVTPFCIGCPSCGQCSLQHVNWHGDERVPKHKLHTHQRFFRDGTPDEAEASMQRRIELLKDEYPVDEEHQRELIEAARSGKDPSGEPNEFRQGSPVVDVEKELNDMEKEEFKNVMAKISQEADAIGDLEMSHAQADELLCKALREAGYEDGVDIYEKLGKWYA